MKSTMTLACRTMFAALTMTSQMTVKTTIGRAVTLNEAFFELLPVCFGACTPKYLKA